MDDFTRYTWVFFLVDKSDVFAIFKSFIKGIYNEFETTIKRVRSDNGSEFKNTRIDGLYDKFGIDINSRPSTLHNQMALLRGKIEHSLMWQGLCLVSIVLVNLFGLKLSTRLAIVATASIVTD